MATRTLTPRQEEVRDLVVAGKTVKEVAELLETSEQAIYSQVGKLRKLGQLPKAKARGGRRIRSRVAKPAAESGRNVAGNGGGKVEQVVANELGSIRSRIGEIVTEQERLRQEAEDLSVREQRLDAAQQALNGGGPAVPVA